MMSIANDRSSALAANTPRKPWLAAVLSLVLPGFGQLYNGQINKALTVLLLVVLIGAVGFAGAALYAPAGLTAPVLLLGLMLSVGIWVYSVIDGWRTARKRSLYALEPWQTGAVYVAVFCLLAFVVFPFASSYVRNHLAQAFRIPSVSMQPTLQAGDMLFADMRYNCPNCKTPVQRGDVVIFVYPDNRNLYFVKRVIGLPGDRVSISGGIVEVNGDAITSAPSAADSVTERLDEREWQTTFDATADLAERVVAPGHVFLLGDARAESRDSRHVGDVPLSDVVALPRQIWFSRGADGVRWGRIGTTIQP